MFAYGIRGHYGLKAMTDLTYDGQIHLFSNVECHRGLF